MLNLHYFGGNCVVKTNKKLNLFISYSHKDNCEGNSYIEQFKKHITSLKEKGLIEDWYDLEILPGEDYQSKIDNKLGDADIICLFISANFLCSNNCKEEEKKALKLKKQKGISVIPVILSPSEWKDDEDISRLLALPTDGKPVTKFEDPDKAWFDVCNGLKKVIEKEMKIRQLKIREEFEAFLKDAEMLTKAHPQKETVSLDDILIYPELDNYEKVISSSKELLKNLLDYPRIAIVGEDQSGKTTLCKMIFKELRRKNFVPVYISDGENSYAGKMENKISQSFHKQYEEVDINKIDKERIVPILDDFHLAKNKEKHIKDLSIYARCVIVVDDIFSLNIENKKLIESFDYFKIRELKPSLRNELIKKWVGLQDKEFTGIEVFQKIDKNTELINSTLGKTIDRRGIMPAYPFFILSAMVTYETFSIPLDQEITSQGYCYQAFIYFYLRKQGAKSDEIDTYINFLTELAFYIYKGKKYSLSPHDFESFVKSYLDKYNLPIKKELLFKNLKLIFSADSFNNYSFQYLYLYYFFVAKYLADHFENEGVKEKIEKIIENLHVDENAYIAIFIIHHSKNSQILKEIKNNALCLFDKYKPATLTKNEVNFFDEQANIIVKAVLPSVTNSPASERTKRLKTEDKLEQSQKNIEQKEEAINKSLGKDLRSSIRTVEVMGHIIKNRAGSLEKTELEEMFKEAMNIHLRILSSFFEIIKNKNEQKALVNFIVERLKKINKESKRELSDEKLKKEARIIFWNLNFFIVYGLINKIIYSLGSDKLTNVVEKICNEADSPASFTVKHGILMWYNKNLQIDEICKKVKEKDFSEVAVRTIKFIIINYSSLHNINYKNRQQLESKLKIKIKKL